MTAHEHHSPTDHGPGHDRDGGGVHGGGHDHAATHLDEAHWHGLASHLERDGEVLLDFVTDTAARIDRLRGAGAAVHRVIDVGCGPGVAACELARLHPDAEVWAVDASAAMLERAAARAEALGLSSRVRTVHSELPDGLDDAGPADIIWASMSLHHVRELPRTLRLLGARLSPTGVLAVAELAEPMHVLPADLGFGRPGLCDRLDAVGAHWFSEMRAGLDSDASSQDLPALLAECGFAVVDQRIARIRFDAPLADELRVHVAEHLRQVRHQFGASLDADDRATLDALLDEDGSRFVAHREDTFLDASREIVLARVA